MNHPIRWIVIIVHGIPDLGGEARFAPRICIQDHRSAARPTSRPRLPPRRRWTLKSKPIQSRAMIGEKSSPNSPNMTAQLPSGDRTSEGLIAHSFDTTS
jgi:hypothetical protein